MGHNVINFSVIICTYNRADQLKLVLDELIKQRTDTDCEILVIDNNSTDHTKDVICSFDEVRYIKEEHQGKPYALNRGIREAQSDWIVFTDDDVTYDANWLAEIAAIIRDTNLKCFFCKILPQWNELEPDWYESRMGSVIVQADHGDDIKHKMNYLVGANMGIHRSIFKEYGYFNEEIKRFEDSEFSMRINKEEDIVYFPKAIVYHPIASERHTKRYFIHWYREMGEIIDSRLLKNENHKIFGVPRWIYRKRLEFVFKSIGSLQARNRFYARLQLERMRAAVKELRRKN